MNAHESYQNKQTILECIEEALEHPVSEEGVFLELVHKAVYYAICIALGLDGDGAAELFYDTQRILKKYEAEGVVFNDEQPLENETPLEYKKRLIRQTAKVSLAPSPMVECGGGGALLSCCLHILGLVCLPHDLTRAGELNDDVLAILQKHRKQ
jgi:hypothetical protein